MGKVTYAWKIQREKKEERERAKEATFGDFQEDSSNYKVRGFLPSLNWDYMGTCDG